MSFLTALLLQADTLPKAAAAAPVAAPEESISMLYLLREGGILMIPLLICSIILVYVFVERFMALRKAAMNDAVFMERIKEQLEAGNFNAARSLCRGVAAPEARMIEKGISRIGRPLDSIEKSMEAVGKQEVFKLEKNLSVLNTLASIAPMFGFLGTIFGMIKLFFDIQHKGFVLSSFAGGIYTKMVTSAVGLIIGLISYVAYKYLTAMLNRHVARMEAASADFLDTIHEPAPLAR